MFHIDYSFEREHVGLRRLAGYGVTVTRGAASGMMWTYSCLLITMSRNTITFLRETFLHRFIPFDSFHAFHKLIAFEALFFTGKYIYIHPLFLFLNKHICIRITLYNGPFKFSLTKLRFLLNVPIPLYTFILL